MQFEVLVELKKEVLDTEGRAIQQTLSRLGHKSLTDVMVSKRFVINVDEDSGDTAEKLVHDLAAEHLANPVSETFQVRKL